MALVEQYEQALKALLPQGEIWEKVRENESLKIKAEMFADFDMFLETLVKEANVETTVSLLHQWAELYGIDTTNLSDTDAQKSLLLKKNAKGGSSVAYFEQIIKSYGIKPQVTECLPVMCGLSECGDEDMCGDEDTVYMWFVKAPETAEILKSFLTKYKPAHTTLFFENEV